METRKRVCSIVGGAVIVILLSSGCEDGTPYYRTASAIELEAEAGRAAARETAVAQATRGAMEASARGTAECLANEAQATAQVLHAQGTAQAQSVEATREAWALQATMEAAAVQQTQTAEVWAAQATQTVESRNAQATATQEARLAAERAAQATATVQTALDNAQATAVQATAASVARENERERLVQPLRTFGPWLLLLLGVILAVAVGLAAWRLFEDRARLVRRGPDEGEPLMIITRERLALPLRQFSPYMDLTHGQENAPLLAPTIEAQENTTMRQQTANALQARQVGKVAEAKHGGGAHKIVMLPPGKRAQSRTRAGQEPGLLGVQAVGQLSEATAAGLLSPRLAEAIEAQWHEVEEVE